MPTSKMLQMTTAILLVLAAFAVGPAFAGEAEQSATITPQAGSPLPDCGLEIELPGQKAQAEMCPAVQPEPEFLAKPPRRGFCRCGCGGGCTTDADCGPGGQCVAFISCC